jgi:hypothetical protein
VTITQSKWLNIPSITASAALGLHGEPTFSAASREHNDASAGSASAARILKG